MESLVILLVWLDAAYHIIPVTFQQEPFTYDAYGCSGTYTWMKSPGYTVNLSGMLPDTF